MTTRTRLLALGAVMVLLVAALGVVIVIVAPSLLPQLANPIVAAAVAFVAGAIFNALIDFVGRELSAASADKRQDRRERKQAWLDSIDITARHIETYFDYLNRRTTDASVRYDAEKYTRARFGFVGDVALLHRMQNVVLSFAALPPGERPPDEQFVELMAARDAALNALERQADRVLEGKAPVMIPREEVESIATMESITRESLELHRSRQP